MKPYAPSPEAAAIVVRRCIVIGGFELCFSHEDWTDDQETADGMLQEYANAIADDVHEAELADLRARIEDGDRARDFMDEQRLGFQMRASELLGLTVEFHSPNVVFDRIIESVADLRARIEKATALTQAQFAAGDAEYDWAALAAILDALKGSR